MAQVTDKYWYETAEDLAKEGQTQFVSSDGCSRVTMIGTSILTPEIKSFRPIAVFKARVPEAAAREQLNAEISQLAGLQVVPPYRAVTDFVVNGKKMSGGGLEQFVPLIPDPAYLEKATPELRAILQRFCDERGALSHLRAMQMAKQDSPERKVIFTAIEQESIENLYIFQHLTLQHDMTPRNLMWQLTPKGTLKLLEVDTEASFGHGYEDWPLVLAFPHIKRKISAEKWAQILQWKLADFKDLVDQNPGLADEFKRQFVERFESLQDAARTMKDKAIIEIAYEKLQPVREAFMDMRYEGFFTSSGVEFDASTYDSVYRKETPAADTKA